MNQPLPRYTDHRAADQRKLAQILLETGDPAPTTTTSTATLPGDTRRLRGIPVAGGACGTSPGTDPLAAAVRLDNIRPGPLHSPTERTQTQ